MTEKQSGKRHSIRIPELLAPAGNFEKLKTAIHYGADAVYLGGGRYGLRAKAGNFDLDGIKTAVAYADDHQVKVYVTVNIFAHNQDFKGLERYLLFLRSVGVAGLVVADPGIFALCRKTVPDMEIHLSTQMNVTNGAAARFWIDQGASRLNLARELSLTEIADITRKTDGEIEVFVHGALCISYSGRCLLSSYLTGRDANRGNCAHPCRYRYALVEEKRAGDYFPVEEDERGTYLFNSKDLCLLRRLPELVAAGVHALKIEGRMKSIFYVGGVVRIYRAALDFLKSVEERSWNRPELIEIPERYYQEIARTGTRGLTENFFESRPGPSEMLYQTTRFEQPYEPVAVVRKEGTPVMIEARNVLFPGEQLEYMHRGVDCTTVTVARMTDENGDVVAKANPGNIVYAHCTGTVPDFAENGLFRRSTT
ncbi:MAG: peptidase U32 [Proteobacteria bacterium]|nr:MAG: peptidase U32 [Pseudomonadota bacterium]PIE64346.1 MAG: peptidase U32 [Desulfobacterales bacterium]